MSALVVDFYSREIPMFAKLRLRPVVRRQRWERLMRRAGWMLLPTAVVVAGVAGVAAAGPGSSATIAYAASGDGLFGNQNGVPVLVSVRVPRGHYVISGKVTLLLPFDAERVAGCRLLLGNKELDTTGNGKHGNEWSMRVGSTNGAFVPLQGVAKVASPTTIAIKCSTVASAVEHHARLTAIKVTRLRFQAPA